MKIHAFRAYLVCHLYTDDIYVNIYYIKELKMSSLANGTWKIESKGYCKDDARSICKNKLIVFIGDSCKFIICICDTIECRYIVLYMLLYTGRYYLHVYCSYLQTMLAFPVYFYHCLITLHDYTCPLHYPDHFGVLKLKYLF